MERDHQTNNQEIPIQLSHVKQESFSRKPNAVNIGGDRVKRDEWSEDTVLSLLEVYESKWVLRNRAKLKGQDWEDVAKYVSSKACSTNKTPKTPTQCKNKIESMKKRYRAESAGGHGGGEHVSSWPLFNRLHHLLGGPGVNGGGSSKVLPPPSPPPVGPTMIQSLPLVEGSTVVAQTDLPPMAIESTQNSLHSIGPQQLPKEERLPGNEEAKLSEQVSDSDGAKSPMAMETDSSTPALYGSKNRNSKLNSKMKVTMEKRKRRRISRDTDIIIAESIRFLAEAVLKTEQVRMETTKEMEKMRAEVEAKRAEIDLKRTEIIAETQLEIAKIFASSGGGPNVGSSVMIKKC